MSPAICFNLDQSKILTSGNGLMQLYELFIRDPYPPFLRTFLVLFSTFSISPVEANFLSRVFSPFTSQKHVRKVVGGFGKKSCVSTGVRKPGKTCASPTTMI